MRMGGLSTIVQWQAFRKAAGTGAPWLHVYTVAPMRLRGIPLTSLPVQHPSPEGLELLPDVQAVLRINADPAALTSELGCGLGCS